MPSMFNHNRDGWTSLPTEEEGSDLDIDELAQFITENDREASESVSEPIHRRCLSQVSNIFKCFSDSARKCKSQTCGILVSVSLMLATTVICLGLGVTSMVPLPVIDISIEAFNIPNHIAYKHYTALALALKHNSSVHGHRSKREVPEVDLGASSQHPSFKHQKHSGIHSSPEGHVDKLQYSSGIGEIKMAATSGSKGKMDMLQYSDSGNHEVNASKEGQKETVQYKSFKDMKSDEVDEIASKMAEEVRSRRVKRHNQKGGCIFGYQAYPRWKMQVIFLAQGDDNLNMFTKERLEHVHKVEQMIISHPEFRHFCLKDYKKGRTDPAVHAQEDCAPLNSLMTYFFPTTDQEGHIFYDGLGNNLDEVESALKLAMNEETFYYFVDEKINKTFHHSKLLRTEVIFGAPLEGYCFRRVDERQEKLFKKFIITYIDILGKASNSKVQVLYGGNELFDYEVEMTFWQDIRMAYFTLGFIILLMFILTSFSVWLTFWGMLSILLSFPLSLFFYRNIFNIDALGILNGAAAFVIIGIGVDDVFVFVNIFRQASHIKDRAKRISYTVRTAGKATFFTSFTTAAAFAANIASSIPAVSEFGLFMALIVSSCWLTVILIMPSALYLWVLCFARCETACFKCIRCFGLNRPADPIDAQQGPRVHSSNLDDDVPMLHIDEERAVSGNTIADDDEEEDDIPMLIPDPYSQSVPEPSTEGEGFYVGLFLQTLIGKYLAKFIVKGRWILIACFGVLLVGSVVLMTRLQPATHPPQLFKPDTNLQRLLDLKANFSIIQSLSCYKCSAMYKVKQGQTTTAAPRKANTTPLPSHPTTHLPPPTTPMTSSISSSTWSTQQPKTTVETTTTTTTTTMPATTERLPHVEPQISKQAGSVAENFNACRGQDCDNLKDRPNLRIGTKVFVVFGIKDIDRSGVEKGHVLNEFQGRTVFDKSFTQKSMTVSVLKDLCRVCKLIAANQELVKKGSARCIPPVIPKVYLQMLERIPECRSLPNSQLEKSSITIQSPVSAVGGMSPDSPGLLWLAFAFESTTSEGQSYFDGYKQYQKWEAFMQHIKETELDKDSPLQDMFQASEFWKKVMMEVVAVSSAIYGLALSMAICIIAIAIFTGHIGLLFIVVITIIAMICLVVGIFYLAGWEMGAVEAISLSILVGSSVDYCVHLVEGYLIAYKQLPRNTDMKNSSIRQWRTSFALRHIGVAIISSAITTIIAAIPLTQTIIQPFSKFGDIVLINTSVSIVFTLLLCGALLTTIAPAKFTSSWKASGIALVITGIVVGLITLVLFVISRTVMNIPGPNGEPLFGNAVAW